MLLQGTYLEYLYKYITQKKTDHNSSGLAFLICLFFVVGLQGLDVPVKCVQLKKLLWTLEPNPNEDWGPHACHLDPLNRSSVIHTHTQNKG